MFSNCFKRYDNPGCIIVKYRCQYSHFPILDYGQPAVARKRERGMKMKGSDSLSNSHNITRIFEFTLNHARWPYFRFSNT